MTGTIGWLPLFSMSRLPSSHRRSDNCSDFMQETGLTYSPYPAGGSYSSTTSKDEKRKAFPAVPINGQEAGVTVVRVGRVSQCREVLNCLLGIGMLSGIVFLIVLYALEREPGRPVMTYGARAGRFGG